MRFDNKQFERGVDETLKSIQELKNSLDFEESVKSLDSLSKAGKRFNFDGVSDAIDAVRVKFSAFEVAVNTTIERVVNNALNAAKNMASAFTIDPIKQGFGIYEQKMNSVMTIMNNSGKSLEEVNDILQQLNNYSDKTIYSLNDMTTALGKFTAAGIDATEAVDIIKGAANEAATMGADAASFSRFIYNLSQAYSVGKMTMIDWKSLENAGIAGTKFKQTLVDAARELGTINDEFEKKHGVVSATNLREFLKEGIITNEVMTQAFKQYANAAGYEGELGEAAERAATQVKTFNQLMDVLKESVASQWSQTWTYIIGDFNEARKLWTSVSHMFDETIGKMVESKKEMFRLWHEGFVDPETGKQISGRMLLIDGLCNLLQTFIQLAKPVKEAFREIFPAKTAESLWEATKAFRDFTNRLRLSETTMQNIKDFASGIFSVIKTVRTVFKDLLAAIFPATEGVDSLLAIILHLAGAFGRFLTKVTTALRESEEYQTVMKGIGQAVLVLIKIIAVLGKTLFNVGKVAKDTGILQKILSGIVTVAGKIVSIVMTYGPKVLAILGSIAQIVMGIVGLVAGGIGNGINFFKGLFSKKDGNDAAKAVGEVTDSITSLTKTDVNEAGENVTKGFGAGLLAGLSGLMDIVKRIFGGVITFVEKIFGIESPSKVFIAIGGFILSGLLIGLTNPTIRGKITDSLADFANSGIIQGFKNVLSKAFNGLASLWAGAANGIVGLIHRISENIQGLGKESDGFAGKIGNLFSSLIKGMQSLNWAAVLLTAAIGTALVGVIKLLNIGVNIASFFNTVGSGFRNITSSFRVVSKAFNNFTKALKRAQNPILGTLRAIAFSILAITTALLVLSSVEDKNSLWMSAAILAGSLLAIVALITAAAKRIKTGELEESMDQLAKMMLVMAATMAVMTIALTAMVSMISNDENSIGAIIGAFVGMTFLAAVVGGLTYALSQIEFKSSLKAVAMMLSFAVLMSSVVRNLKKIANMKNEENLMDAVIALGSIIAAIGIVTMMSSFISWGGMFALLAMSILMRSIVYAINSVDWNTALKSIEDNYKVVIAIIGVLTAMTVGAALLGSGIEKFGQGMKNLAIALILMAGAIAVIKLMNVGSNDIVKLIGILAELAGLYTVIMLVSRFAKVPKKSLKELSTIIRSLGLVIVEMAVAAGLAAKLGATGGTIAGVGLAIAAFMGGITLILTQIKNARGDNDLKDLAKLIRSFTLPIIALAVLTKVYNGSTAGDIFGVIITLVAIFGGIAAVCTMAGDIEEDQVKFLSRIVAILLVSVGGLVLLSMVPFTKLLASAGALAAVLMSLFAVIKAAGSIEEDALKPLIAITVSLIVVCGSLVTLAQLADWQNVLAAAGAMAITLLAVAGALALVNKLGDDAVKGALALVIASASLIIIGISLSNFIDSTNWDAVLQACVSLLAVAGSLAAVSAFGVNAIAGAAGLVIASAALIVVGYAMEKFMDIDWGGVGKMAACLGILTGFVAIFAIPAIGEFLMLGAIGLALAGAALVVVAAGMRLLNGVDKGGDYLADLGGGLLKLALAGIVLLVGAPGLIAGGLGLVILAAGLRILNGVNPKIVNEKSLSGIANGLAQLGLAGVVLALGAAGLILGGIGLTILSGALALMDNLDYKQLSKKNLEGLGKGLMRIATAGIVGTLAGPGLIVLATGMTALAGALRLYSKSVDTLIEDMKTFGDTEAVYIGANIVYGMNKGLVEAAPTLLTTSANVFNSMVSTICAVLGIHSPSEVLRKIGEFTGWGFLEGWANSDFVQKLDKVSAAIAEEGVIQPFAETLMEGFGNIGDIFKGVNLFGNTTESLEQELAEAEDTLHKLITRKRIMVANGTDAGAIKTQQNLIDQYEKKVEELKQKIKDSDIFSGFTSIFEGLQNGFEGFTNSYAPDLESIIKDIGIEMGGTSLDANALAGGLEEVSAASATTTQRFGENINMLSEFDRSLKKTVADIEKDMIDRLLGTDQWNKYLRNMEALGYDPALIKEVADMGMDSGYAWAAAFVAAGQNEAEMNKITKAFRLGQTSKVENDPFYQYISAKAEANEKGVRNIKNYLVTEADKNGEMKLIAGKVERDADLDAQINDSLEKATHEETMYDWLKQWGIQVENGAEAANAAADKYQQAQENADASAADAAMSYMADAIKGAINTYMPPEEFAVIGQNVCLGFGAGVMANAYWPVEKVEEFARSVIEAFCKVTKVESPSKVFEEIGEYIVEGLSLGLEDTTDAERATADLGKGVTSMMMKELDRIQKMMETEDIWQPTIRPVVDFSSIQSGAENAQMLFDRMNIDAAAREFANFKVATTSPSTTMAGMSKDEFASFLQDFANVIVDGINQGQRNITVPITIKNDPHKQFTAMVDENDEYKRVTGKSAFV